MDSYNVANGKNGNLETIQMMTKVARAKSRHPFIRAFTLKLIQSCGVASQHHLDEAICIGNYVKENVRYVRDPDNIELLTDPVLLLEQAQKGIAQGDCDDMALLIATMLLAVGCLPYFRAARYWDTNGNYNHIYVVVYEKNWGEEESRVVLDAILKRYPIGTEVPQKSGDEFAA